MYDVILINEDTVTGLENKAKHLLDTGKIIYYANPQLSNEEIAKQLAIAKEGVSNTNPYELVATVIYKVDDIVIFENIYQVSVGENVSIPKEIILEHSMISAVKS